MRMVNNLIASLEMAETYEEAASVLYQTCDLIDGFKRKDRHLPFRCGGYEFRVFLPAPFARVRDILQRCNGRDISCAPQLVSAIEYPSGEGCVVSHIEGMEDGDLLSCERQSVEVSDEAFEQLVRDLCALEQAELFHPYASLSFAHWYLHPNCGRVFLDRWDAVRRLEPGEGERLSQQMTELMLWR